MAITWHLTRNEEGGYDRKKYLMPPMDFVISKIPDSTPFHIYIESIGDDNDVTEDFDALQEDAEFFVVESAGAGAIAFYKFIFKPIMALLTVKAPSAPIASNSQASSPNNSLTDRNNKARPYERVYDICGTVQSIPNNLMTTYGLYDVSGSYVEYGYFSVARGHVHVASSGVTDGDTLLSSIDGSSAEVYPPFNSPNSGSPQLVIGNPVNESLYITAASNEVDGQTLKAPNDLSSKISDGGNAYYSAGIGTITDNSGGAAFSDYIKVGDSVTFSSFYVDGYADLNGIYQVTYVDNISISVNASPKLDQWQNIGSVQRPVKISDNPVISPYDTNEAAFTSWTSLTRIKSERIVINVSAPNGMYFDWGNGKIFKSVSFMAQYQLLDDDNNPYGPVYSKSASVSGKTSDEIGTSLIINLPSASKVRVRVRRTSDYPFDYVGAVVDEIKYNQLFGQIIDRKPNYGDMTTVHTSRRQTVRATTVKSPQLRMIVTEKLYKYIGNGAFESTLSNNTQAVQSLIRLLRDPVCGNLNLTNENMDALLAVQDEIESYFGNPEAGQFCYTFDSYDLTMQDIINIIAEAIFCKSYREGNAVLLDFDRPRIGPEMVFTHRSKAPGEKWTRNFNTRDRYDSLKFSYIDPDTNIKETITIPEEGGVKTETYDSKGIRNYRQAYWAAYRRYQRNLLNRVAVEFTAMEEGILARPGRAISVVKGSRVSPFDGYVVAVDGLTLVLSQNVEFTDGDDHSLILKKRDGTVQSVGVVRGHNDRTVIMTSAPQEAIYTGNNALKTEFSFGNEQRHNGQMVIVSTVEPGSDRTVKITGYNYTDDYYAYDGVSPFGRGFSDGFSNGFL